MNAGSLVYLVLFCLNQPVGLRYLDAQVEKGSR